MCAKCAPAPRQLRELVCEQCRAPVPRGHRYCLECQPFVEEVKRKRRQERRRTRRVKPCRGCGRAKGRVGRGAYCDACRKERELAVRSCERCPNPVRAPHAKLCVECKAAARREATRRNREWQRKHAGRSAGKKSLESHRLRRMLKAEAAGKLRAVEPTKNGGSGLGVRPDAAVFPDLPAAPLVAAMQREINRRRNGLFMFAPVLKTSSGKLPPDPVRELFCEQAGVSDKTFRRWVSEGSAVTSFDTVDGVLTRLGWLWFDVYRGDEVCSNGMLVRDVFESTELIAA